MGGDLCRIYRLDKKRRDKNIGDLWKAVGDCVQFFVTKCRTIVERREPAVHVLPFHR